MRQVIVGAGQIGSALATVLGCDLVDVEGPQGQYDVLHIAFPYVDAYEFEWAVGDYQHRTGTGLTIIHSTVPVGTSRRLDAVHSPVTGKHPHLAESLRTFVKFFGGHRAAEAALLWPGHSECYPDQETTEAGKLWATLQYGWLIAIEKECRRFAVNHRADPDVVYRRFNEVYNEGYAALGLHHSLPILDDVPGPIGGHCVIPNARITPASIARLLVRMNAGW